MINVTNCNYISKYSIHGSYRYDKARYCRHVDHLEVGWLHGYCDHHSILNFTRENTRKNADTHLNKHQKKQPSLVCSELSVLWAVLVNFPQAAQDLFV